MACSVQSPDRLALFMAVYHGLVTNFFSHATPLIASLEGQDVVNVDVILPLVNEDLIIYGTNALGKLLEETPQTFLLRGIYRRESSDPHSSSDCDAHYHAGGAV